MTSAFRITQNGVRRTALDGLQGNLGRLQHIQEQLSSGRRVNRPSDSPVDAVASLQYRADLRRTEQHVRNAQDGIGWLGTADTALTSMLGVTRRLRELVLRGLNASMGPSERAALAAEVEGLRENALGLANTRYLDRPVFAGTVPATGSYDASTGAFLGNVGDDASPGSVGKVMRSVASGVQVRVNLTGAEVFGAQGDPGSPDLFALMAKISEDLRSDPNALGADLQALDERVLVVQNQLARVGARYHQVETMRDRANEHLLTIRTGLSEVEDIDLPKTILDLQMQEVAYQSALAATARVIQPSLLDFLG